MAGLAFEILIDEALAKIASSPHLGQLTNKHVISLINDFEDAEWRYGRLKDYLWNNIAQTALSEKERSALSDQHHGTLVAAAQSLRLTDKDVIGEGSEIAEVFLYGFMRQRFHALPVVPKIFYKQNVQDNAKGADSVHIVIDGDDFTLWFGEAKFYNSIVDARLDAVVTSVMNSLSTDKLKKENAIITSVTDLDDLDIPISLREKIKSALDNRNSIDDIKSKIHIPILLLHECTITSGASDLSDSYKAEIISFHKKRANAYFEKQLTKAGSIHKYQDLHFHIILFPVPDKKRIVDEFLASVAYFKGSK
jgi:hypothetical protein